MYYRAVCLFIILFVFLFSPVEAKQVHVFYEKERPLMLVGTEETVYDWDSMHCDNLDLPDMPARAFRDNTGTIHLIASHNKSRQFTGTTFSSMTRSCTPTFITHQTADPSLYDDNEWLWSFYYDTTTGITHSIIHHEYEANFHPQESGCTYTGLDAPKCQWDSLLYASSVDNGYTYAHQSPPNHLVTTLPYTYVPNIGKTVGYGDPSSIIYLNGYWYTMFAIYGYLDQKGGSGIMRTDNISNSSRWRMWNGTGFTIDPVNPYTEPGFDPKLQVTKPLDIEAGSAGSLSYNSLLGKYMLIRTTQINYPNIRGSLNRSDVFVYALSNDLIHWEPNTVFWVSKPIDYFIDNFEAYPSLIDHQSPSQNYDIAGATPHFYFRREFIGPLNSHLNRSEYRAPLRILPWTSVSQILSSVGFDYFGLSLNNSPAVGNDFLEIISNNQTSSGFFSDVERKTIQFNRQPGTKRFGVQGTGFPVFLDNKSDFSNAYYFSNIADYTQFILQGTLTGGVALSPLFFDSSFVLTGGYGFLATNGRPDQVSVVLSTPPSSRPNETFTCLPIGIVDAENNAIFNTTTFQFRGKGDTNMQSYEAAVYTFDLPRSIPEVGNYSKDFHSDVIEDYAGLDNSLIVRSGSMPTHVTGALGRAYSFVSTDNLIAYNGSGLEPLSGNGFSIEMWIKTSAATGDVLIISNDDPTDTQSFYYYVGTTNGIATFSINLNPALAGPATIDGSFVADGIFHHVAFVADPLNEELRSYVDGTLINSVPWTDGTIKVAAHPSINYLVIGSNPWIPLPFTGIMDEIRIYHHTVPEVLIKEHALKRYGTLVGVMKTGEVWTCENTPNDAISQGSTMRSQMVTASDGNAPNATILVNQNATITNTTLVNIQTTFIDGDSGVSSCRYSLDNATWTPSESCSSSRSIFLNRSNGQQNVFLEVVDNAHNVRNVFDSITVSVSHSAVSFNGQTTNFSKIPNVFDMENIVLEKSAFGSIRFTSTISTNASLNLDTLVSISQNNISIIPQQEALDVPALLTLRGLSFVSPVILRDGVVCLVTQCSIANYTSGTLVFSVSGFSSYTIAEGQNCIDQDQDGSFAFDPVLCSFGNDCNDGDWGIHPGSVDFCGNFIDEDCNGADLQCPIPGDEENTTEGCVEGSTRNCGSSVGECTIGTETCVAGTWQGCTGVSPAQELCDGKDNDCNGQTDNGCICLDKQVRVCGSNIGECQEGTSTCAGGQWGPCIGGIDPAPSDICGNDIDDNCNLVVDENCETNGNACGNGIQDSDEEGIDCGGSCGISCNYQKLQDLIPAVASILAITAIASGILILRKRRKSGWNQLEREYVHESPA